MTTINLLMRLFESIGLLLLAQHVNKVACRAPPEMLWDESVASPMSVVLNPTFWETNRGYAGQLTALLEQAVADGISVDSTNSQGWAAITFAAEYLDVDAIDILCRDFNANVNIQENDGWSPLMFGAFHGDEQVVRRLVEEYSADISLLNNAGVGASALLRRKGLFDLAEQVTREGLSYAMDRMASSSPLITSTILDVLHDSTSNPKHHHTDKIARSNYGNWANKNGWTPLHFCANSNDVVCIDILLGRYEANVNAKEADNWTPLMFAAFHGYVDSVTAILAFDGTLLRVEDNNGIFGSVDLETKNNADITVVQLAQQRLLEVGEDKKERFGQVLELLVKHTDKAVIVDTEKRPVDTSGRGIFDAVGTFIFGGVRDEPKNL